MFKTDDPIADFNAWDAECERGRDKLPRCTYCNEVIDDDHWSINDEPVCDECLWEHHRKRIEDYFE